MTQDSDSLKVRLAALQSDSTLWDGVATDLDGQKSAAQALTLDAGAVSHVAAQLGFLDTYHTVQSMLTTLLGLGADNARHVSTALNNAAVAYQGRDQETAHTFNSMKSD